MKLIASQVAALKSKGDKKNFYIFFTPRRRMICERVLEEAGIYEGSLDVARLSLIAFIDDLLLSFVDITISEFHMDLVPFDSDVLSMELPNAFRDCALEGDRYN